MAHFNFIDNKFKKAFSEKLNELLSKENNFKTVLNFKQSIDWRFAKDLIDKNINSHLKEYLENLSLKELQEIKNSQQEVKSELQTCTTQSKKLKTLNQNYLKFYKNIKDKSTLSLKVLERNRRRSQLVQNLISSPDKDDLVKTCQQQKENRSPTTILLCR